jgi:predicted nucleic-acid-binding Zn-ribbon protein
MSEGKITIQFESEFGSTTSCLKCGYGEFTTKYVPIEIRVILTIPEHLELKCLKCGFISAEKTKDSE